MIPKFVVRIGQHNMAIQIAFKLLKQALLTLHVKHGYVNMGVMTDKSMCYMVTSMLGFHWLKNNRGVIVVVFEQK